MELVLNCDVFLVDEKQWLFDNTITFLLKVGEFNRGPTSLFSIFCQKSSLLALCHVHIYPFESSRDRSDLQMKSDKLYILEQVF